METDGLIAPERVSPEQTAFFFDFDGTLADIAEDPSLVSLPADTRRALERLAALSGGAVAIVSGRTIAELQAMLAPLDLPLAGVHGLERRTRDGRLILPDIDRRLLHRIAEQVRAYADRETGLLCEVKSASVTLHYRQRPDLADACLAFARQLTAAEPDLHLLEGKMVFEFKLAARTKADAIAEFMDEPPFAGRTPLFAGDDVTDEDGFRLVKGADGIAIKVGAGASLATFRAADTTRLRAWLQRLVGLSSEEQG